MPLVVPAELLAARHSNRGGAFHRMEKLRQGIRRRRGVVMKEPDPLDGVRFPGVAAGGGRELLEASVNSCPET
ncbi:hypothetical protein D3C71_2229790 [compost metagenome]